MSSPDTPVLGVSELDIDSPRGSEGRRVETIMHDRILSDPNEMANPYDVSQTEAILAHFYSFAKSCSASSFRCPLENAYPETDMHTQFLPRLPRVLNGIQRVHSSLDGI